MTLYCKMQVERAIPRPYMYEALVGETRAAGPDRLCSLSCGPEAPAYTDESHFMLFLGRQPPERIITPGTQHGRVPPRWVQKTAE